MVSNCNASFSSNCSSYLKDFFIKYSGSKDYDSLGVHDRVGTALQPLGGLLLTVQDESDGLLVHTDGHAMPPGREETQKTQVRTHDSQRQSRTTQSSYFQDNPE